MTFGLFLLWAALPFVCATLAFGRFKGDTVYYDSEDYDGNGTAH